MDSRWSPMKFLRSAFHARHDTKMSSWLPPVECWEGSNGLPYGWESAIDKDGKIYYINHTNRTTTADSPVRRRSEECVEEERPREVVLVRDPHAGFGFVAGSEKPVIVRFVTDGGPNEKKLMPGDQILKINGEDVMRSPREHVIELIRSCKQTVNLLVCQPQTNNTTRKSALLTAAKKAKLKNNPSKVRFSEGVTINGSPLFSPVDGTAPFLPNVLKVFLENGQTKSFKYDANTTVQDVLNSLFEKLSIKCTRHFCLATEHVKITRKNRLTILDPKDELAKIASRPGAHHLRCVLRVAFVPRDAQDLLKNDPTTFEYLYMQCCNDVVEERFMPELKYEIALRLTAVHMQQHCLSTGIATAGKVTLKTVERECGGLERFVPASLLDSMRGKELRKLLSHFLKACHKIASPLQAKLYFLRSVGDMPSYGAKCFPTNITDSNPEMTVLVSPRFGISQISCSRNTVPVPLCRLEEVCRVEVEKEDEWSCLLHIHTKERQPLTLSMEEKDANEFVLLLCGYHRLLNGGGELQVERHESPLLKEDTVPSFHSRHMVHESPWSYPPPSQPPGLRTLDLTSLPPPYTPCEMARQSPKHLRPSSPPPVDHNMNETLLLHFRSKKTPPPPTPPPTLRRAARRSSVDERHPGLHDHRLLSASTELLKDEDVDVDIHEAKNDELIRRLAEVERIVADASSYLDSAGEEAEASTTVVLQDRKTNTGQQDPPPPTLRRAARRSSVDERHPGLHDHRLLSASTELLKDEDVDVDIHEAKNDELIRRLAEVERIVADASSYLDSAGEEAEASTTVVLQDREEFEEAEDSPVHLRRPCSPVRNPLMRRDSSFGLHSPDMLPLEVGENILDILRDMREAEEEAEADLSGVCLDPDLIDLTAIPPPSTPEVEEQGMEGEAIDPPPGLFDGGNIEDHLLSEASTITLDSLESLLASLSPPENDVISKEVDLSAFIIPPPPTSSPGSEEQQEQVIARFLSAAEDIRCLILDPPDDSGYDTFASSSLSSYQSDDSSSFATPTTGPVQHDTPYSYHKDDQSLATPTNDHASFNAVTPSYHRNSQFVAPPTDDHASFDTANDAVNHRDDSAHPIVPALRTSCVEDKVEEVLSPCSTTSSDSSSVILLQQRVGEVESEEKRRRSGSCDDLLEDGNRLHPFFEIREIVRSASWDGMAEEEEPACPTFNTSASLRQNRLRRSFHRGSNHSPKSSTIVDVIETPPTNGMNHKYLLSSPAPNGVKSAHYEQALVDITSMISHLRKLPRPPPTSNKGEERITQEIVVNESRRLSSSNDCKGEERAKVMAARDVLANESRRFVTASKLFVRSAMEGAESTAQEGVAVCVALLNRMAAIGELVANRIDDDVTSRLLLEGLEAVALAHLRTVEAAKGGKGQLMQSATQLATALTALMRTLRTI